MKLRPGAQRPGRFKAAILDWLGVPIGLTDTAFWAEFLGNREAGQEVNSRTMLTLSAVWACTRLISESISTLPLAMYENTGKGKRYAADHWLHRIIHDQPNVDATASVHWEATVAAMLLRGNGRAEKLILGNRLVGLQFLHPDRLVPQIDARGRRVWRYTNRDGTQREIPEERIWNIPGFSLDGREGVSVIGYGAKVFGSALAAQQAASGTFERGLMPTTYFKFPKVLQPLQRDDARTAIQTISGSINAGKPAILEADMDVGTIGINPDEAQLLESRGFSVEEICRWFRVPPFMVGHSEKSTSWGTGIEQQMIGFLMFTLAPWLRRIEQAISKDLLSPLERTKYYPKFAVEGLLRADSAARASFYSAMVNNGILTRDEVRELEEREPMGGNAAVLTVQTAMAPLDSLGTVPTDGESARAALMNWLRSEPLGETQ
jgi:HK97 family phage portal protein